MTRKGVKSLFGGTQSYICVCNLCSVVSSIYEIAL
jgi:hypothetical protein